jgi:DNA-binding GntR family transcriptional regulator
VRDAFDSIAIGLGLMTEDMSDRRNERASETPEFKTGTDSDFVNSPLRQRLKDVLLRRILGGAYKSGDRLVELKIAQEFGTSQAPVREALRDLEATGLVISSPRRGTYVAEVLSEGLREIYAVRGALEEQATRLATIKQSCDLATLELELHGMRVAAAADDLTSLAEHSVKFHHTIVEAAGNRLLTNLWLSLNIETRTTITLLVDGIDLMETADSHRQIIDAIASGDSERASRVAREHQENFERLPTPNARLRKET